MEDGWSSGGAEAWSGSATTVDYGNNIGRSYSNNTTLTGGDPATPSTSGGFSGNSGAGGGERVGGGGGGYSRNLNPKAQLSIDRMPYETSVETIRNIFGRYGRISRVICDYKITEERLNVWLDYEDERVCEAALRENGRKMEKSTIVVMKSSTGGGDDGFRPRGPKKDAWGNNTWNKGDRNSTGGGGGSSANTSASAIEGADWSTDWGGSGGGDNNASSFDSFGDGEDRRSSRGRGRGGGRDRGGRGGGRGRGSGRYQPYDKNDSFGEKADLPPWEDIVAGKSSSSTPSASASGADWGNDDWGSSGGGKEPNQQTTTPSAESFPGWD